MEFSLIEQYFKRPSKHPNIVLGNGDDCALLQTKDTLAMSSDTLIEGTHFLKENISPVDLGYRALAVNLSDLAAMGAKPLAFLLSLSLPQFDANWLSSFSEGLFYLADTMHCDLIGGNTTKGPLAITIQIIGTLPQGKALTRNGAQVNDLVFVTGTLGTRPIRPTPRIELAMQLLNLAHAAIDISDGLIQDLNHILTASNVGVQLDLQSIPGSDLQHALYAGEDYELCFTAPLKNRVNIEKLAAQLDVPLCCIGTLKQKKGVYNVANGQTIEIKGYQHFS